MVDVWNKGIDTLNLTPNIDIALSPFTNKYYNTLYRVRLFIETYEEELKSFCLQVKGNADGSVNYDFIQPISVSASYTYCSVPSVFLSPVKALGSLGFQPCFQWYFKNQKPFSLLSYNGNVLLNVDSALLIKFPLPHRYSPKSFLFKNQ